MGRTHKEQKILANEVTKACKQVTIGKKYQHYKSADKIYIVTGLGFIEANDELSVIYKACYGERLTFIRPLQVWLEEVEWNGKAVPRFTPID